MECVPLVHFGCNLFNSGICHPLIRALLSAYKRISLQLLPRSTLISVFCCLSCDCCYCLADWWATRKKREREGKKRPRFLYPHIRKSATICAPSSSSLSSSLHLIHRISNLMRKCCNNQLIGEKPQLWHSISSADQRLALRCFKLSKACALTSFRFVLRREYLAISSKCAPSLVEQYTA